MASVIIIQENMFIEMLKTAVSKIIHGVLHVMYLFPVKKNRIVFIPANGHYYCNLKYIDQFLDSQNLNVEKIWGIHEKLDMSYPMEVKKIPLKSFFFIYYFYTASVIIFNDSIPSWFSKRKDQVFINTWHGGGAYKKIDVVFLKNPNMWHKVRAYYIFNKIDYMISACAAFTECIKKDVDIHPTFLKIGMPRNDVFFNKIKMDKIRTLVKDRYKISAEVGIVMYAPTFRDNGIKIDLNVKSILDALQKKFHKRFVLFVRSHPHVAKNIFSKMEKRQDAVDVSDYRDMQELLCATDVLITDYSSSMWDFSLTNRPCFIYANDLEKYKKLRNFHTPIKEWPFPLAANNKELLFNIVHFNEKDYVNQVEKHHKELGSYENGHATEAICRLILKICKE